MVRARRPPSPPTVEDAIRELGGGEGADVLRRGWDESAAAAAPGGWPSESEIREAAGFARLDPETAERCLGCLRWVAGSPARISLLWHLYHVLFRSDEASSAALARALPTLTSAAPEPAPLLGALLCLCAVPALRALHAERGIPQSVTVETLRDLGLWIHEHRRRSGRWGFSEMIWLRRHLRGGVVQLGRLQFEITTYGEDFHVFSADDGSTAALAGEGMVFRADGQFADADGLTAAEGTRTARFAESSSGWEGEGMDPAGFASGRVRLLPVARWRQALGRGAPAMAVHIPAGGEPPGNGPMSPEACEASFARARELFGARAFCCTSWLLDPQLGLYLPETSNIIRFQRMFHLLPVRGAGPGQHFERVFGYGTAEPRDAAETEELERRLGETGRRTTVVERALLEHVRRGLHWRIGAGIIPVT